MVNFPSQICDFESRSNSHSPSLLNLFVSSDDSVCSTMVGASAATSEFCEWVQVRIGVTYLVINIRSSLVHLHGFQLLVMLP